MRAVLYVRNSSGKQVAAGTHEGQLDEGRATAERLGAELVAVYADKGISAKSGNLAARGDFARLVADLPTLRPDICVVANVDRLTRSELFRELGAIWGPLQEAGVRVATAGGQVLDLGTPEGQLLAMFESWRAARENAARSERSKRGHARAVREGRAPCATPLGYSTALGETKEAAVVREVFERVAAGETCAAVARDFRRRGVRTARGGTWYASTVIAILRTDTYSTGRWAASPHAKLPALVSPELAAEALAHLPENQAAGRRRTKSIYLLEAIAVCGVCKSPIRIHGTIARRPSGRSYEYRYYACERRRLRIGECSLPWLRTDRIDELVWARLASWIDDPGLGRELVAGLDDPALVQAAADLEDAQRRLAQLDEWTAQTLERGRRGLLGVAAVDAELERIARARALAERQVSVWRDASQGAKRDLVALRELEAALVELRAACGVASPEERRELVQLLVSDGGIEVYPDELRITASVWSGGGRATAIQTPGQTIRAVLVAGIGR